MNNWNCLRCGVTSASSIYWATEMQAQQVQGYITDLWSCDHVVPPRDRIEYLTLEPSISLRLDKIIQIEPLS